MAKIRPVNAKTINNKTAARVRTDTKKNKVDVESKLKRKYIAEEFDEMFDLDISDLTILKRDDIDKIVKLMLGMLEVLKIMMEDSYKDGDYELGAKFFDQILKIIREIRMYAKDLSIEETTAQMFVLKQKLQEVLAKKHEVVTKSLLGEGEDNEAKTIVVQVPEDIEENLKDLLERRTTDWGKDMVKEANQEEEPDEEAQ